MITFKSFLAESRSAPLYHGTNMRGLEGIFKDGIEPRTLHSNTRHMWVTNHEVKWPVGYGSDEKGYEVEKYARGVSLSRNMRFSSQFSSGIVLELDQRRLAQRYKIVPFQYFADSRARAYETSSSPKVRNEYEEFVITNKSIPFSFVNRIWIPQSFIERGVERTIIRDIREKHGSSFIRTYKRTYNT